MEQRKGMLKAGMLADLVVLSADVEKTDPEALHLVHPVMTICDGRITFEG
jgi:predicted amidohydrolase YtcJ